MFIGHFGIAFAAKRAAPRTSLGATFVAAQFADLLWPILLLTGAEHVRIEPNAENSFLTLNFVSYPWSHSLLMQILWGVGLALLYFALSRNIRGSIVIGALVPSHWILDWVVHVPDLPLYPGGVGRFGLGLWRAPTVTIVLELIVFAAGAAVYARTTRARDGVGKFGYWGLVLFLLVLYGASIVSPPPSSVRALAIAALIGWPLSLLPWWVDRHRSADGDRLPGGASR
jgi:hypothetical protein